MFKKLFSIFAALTLSVGLWAINNVPYIDANGVEQKANGVTGVISSTDPVTLNAGWYVVMPTGGEKQTGTLVCQGEVHLIVYDGAKLTATGADNKPGIEVSGEGNSLTIYGYTNQSGQLIAIGGASAAGIGGGEGSSGSNITINGGEVTATGGEYGGAGIGGGNNGIGSNITINGGQVTADSGGSAAGIGGGRNGAGSNIIINGGQVTADSGGSAAGIGGGDAGYGSNIFVATSLVVKADGNNPPTTEITNTGADLAESLAGKQYATVEPKPKGNLTAESFVVSDNNVTYNGEAKAATVEFADGIIGAGEMTVTYKQSDAVIASPISAGEYDIYVAVAEGDNYNAFEAAKISTLTIAKATLTASDFTYLAPDNLTWDGNAKSATVTFNDQSGKLSGCGEVAIKYQKDAVETSPIDAGDYTVSIDVAEGDNYESATALTDEDWKFTIEAASATYTRDVANDSWGTLCLPWASTALEGGIYYDVLGTKDPTQGVALVELGESDQLAAGKPYVFKATSSQIKVTYNPETEVAEEVAGNNIIGSFAGCNVPEGKYIIVNNLLYKTADATSTIAANRAYFDVDAMGEYTPSQAPGRKVVFMGGRTMPTELETVDGSQCTMHNGKFIMNGRFVIVRDGKMYNALGM